MVNFCSAIFLLAFAAAVLIFFIAGLLYLLCLEHVDNLGAYSTPSETGLLIPSVFTSDRRRHFQLSVEGTVQAAWECSSVPE